MYTIQTEACFDSAHFLKGYEGKCSNIHGHRWTVQVECASETLSADESSDGMVMDFADLKKLLRKETGRLDHSLIIEEGSLREKTMEALGEEGFRIIEFPFRPTAEHLARYFYDYLKQAGCPVRRVRVFESPRNVAGYEDDGASETFL